MRRDWLYRGVRRAGRHLARGANAWTIKIKGYEKISVDLKYERVTVHPISSVSNWAVNEKKFRRCRQTTVIGIEEGTGLMRFGQLGI